MALLDNFTGAAGALTGHTSDSGHSWTSLNGSTNLTGNGSIEPGATSAECMAESDWAPASPDYSITITWGHSSSITNSTLGAFLRKVDGSWATLQLYFWQWYSGTIYIYKITTGTSFTLLNSTALAEPADGDVFAFSVSGSSPDAVALTLKQNGSTVLTASDSSSPLYAAGTCGIRTYQEDAISTSTGHKMLVVEAEETGGAGPDAPAYHAYLLENGDAEIAWDTVAGAEQYNIYRAASSGGSFSLLATVLEADPHYHTDTGYSTGNVYKIASENAANGEGDQSSEFEPVEFFDGGVDPATIEDAGPGARHDLLTDGRLATWDNLAFTQKSVDSADLGPTSQAELFDDQFTAGAPLSDVTAGSVLSCGGGSCAVSAGTTLRYGTAVPAPTFNMQVDFTALGDCHVGYGLDSTHGVFARYDASAETIDIYLIDGGAETELMAPVSFPLGAGDKISLECANRIYVVWADTGLGWEEVGDAVKAFNGSAGDLRAVGAMAAWRPIAIFDEAATITRMRLSAFGGTNYIREHALVTYPDGTPFRLANGSYLLGGDRCGLIHDSGAGNSTLAVCFAVHEYDPVAGEIVGGSLATVSQVDENGLTISTSDSKIVFDPGAGGFHCWVNDWTNWQFDGFPTATKVYYQFYSGDTLEGFIHLSTAVPITLPEGFTESFYGVDAIRRNGRWLLCGTRYSGSGTVQVPVIISGDDPDSFDTLEYSDADTEHYSEGMCWFPLGSRLYFIAGDIWNATWDVYVWDATDPSNTTYKGTLDMPDFATGASQSLAHQPTLLWYPNPADESQMIPQIIAYTGPVYDFNYDVGRTWVLEPSEFLDSWQFPLRGEAEVGTPVFGVFESPIIMGAY